MGINHTTIVVTCDFPGCTDSRDSLVHNPEDVDYNMLMNFRWAKIDTGYFNKEYFCPKHSNWFTSRSKVEYNG